MDGFKTLPKMQHFKTGGHAKSEEYCGGGKAMKSGGEVDADDKKQDKKVIKKAFTIHDTQQHEEKTDLSKLKGGGRSKKAAGTVRKFKMGGSITNVYEAKKDSGDKDNIAKVKDIKPGKADAPSGAKEMPNKYKKGSGVKKMADGSLTGRLGDYVMGTDAQNAKAKQDMARYLKAKQMQEAAGKSMGTGEKMAMGLAGLGQGASAPSAPMGQVDAMGNVTGMPAQKRGGRAGKKGC
jgi:hypothetical protein